MILNSQDWILRSLGLNGGCQWNFGFHKTRNLQSANRRHDARDRGAAGRSLEVTFTVENKTLIETILFRNRLSCGAVGLREGGNLDLCIKSFNTIRAKPKQAIILTGTYGSQSNWHKLGWNGPKNVCHNGREILLQVGNLVSGYLECSSAQQTAWGVGVGGRSLPSV